MIGRLTGTLHFESDGRLIVDVRGVGYLVRAPVSTTKVLQPGVEATLLIHTSWSQDQLALYAFATAEELRLFRVLIKIDRVGPKLALSILGSLGPRGLARAVLSSDIRALSGVPGVGKKTAQRLLLELGSQMNDVTELAALAPASSIGSPGKADHRTDAVDALVALGYSRTQASASVAEICRSDKVAAASTQGLLTAALARLSGVRS